MLSHAPPVIADAMVVTTDRKPLTSPPRSEQQQLRALWIVFSQAMYTFSLILASANVFRYASAQLLISLIRLLKMLGIPKRWERFKDAAFYEFALFMSQPSPLLLVLMWPGWALVAVVWWVSSREGRGDCESCIAAL